MNTTQLINAATEALLQAKDHPGKIILITGGPTCEDIDPVRFITNRSTGRMGIEAAIAAKDAGLSPILVLGPTHLTLPDKDIPLINIRSAEDLFTVVDFLFDASEFIIMSAAVADFTPITISESKLKKSEIADSNHEFTLKLKRTKDILKELSSKTNRSSKYIAGFSLDTTINIKEGLKKLTEKGLDLIAINSTKAFEKASSSIMLITKDEKHIMLTDNNKRDTADSIIKELLRFAN